MACLSSLLTLFHQSAPFFCRASSFSIRFDSCIEVIQLIRFNFSGLQIYISHSLIYCGFTIHIRFYFNEMNIFTGNYTLTPSLRCRSCFYTSFRQKLRFRAVTYSNNQDIQETLRNWNNTTHIIPASNSWLNEINFHLSTLRALTDPPSGDGGRKRMINISVLSSPKSIFLKNFWKEKNLQQWSETISNLQQHSQAYSKNLLNFKIPSAKTKSSLSGLSSDTGRRSTSN